MKTLIFVAVFLFASQGSGAFAHAATTAQAGGARTQAGTKAQAGTSLEAQIRRVNERYLDAMNRLDVVVLGRILPDDVVLSNNGVAVVSKAEVLAGVQSMRRYVSSLGFKHTDVFRVSVHDKCAVVTGQQVCPTKHGDERWLFSNLFLWRNNKWQLVEARSDFADL